MIVNVNNNMQNSTVAVPSFNTLLFSCIKTYVVSSVLNRDVKLFGKKFLFDKKEDTCWNSEKGSPQWINLELTEEVVVAALRIRFQGGFAGRTCSVTLTDETETKVIVPIYPEDNNKIQEFPLGKLVKSKAVLIKFDDSTDFFGRIIIYDLEICVDG